MKIHLHFPTKNEERILPYFFRHYDQYVERYFAYYMKESTDKTLEILKSNPKVTIIELSMPLKDNILLSKIRNDFWQKKSIASNCDWIIVCDNDEFLYHPNFLEVLEKYDNEGINFVKTDGYQMYSDKFIETNKQIYDVIKKGVKAENYSKCSLFKPGIIPNYSYGCHLSAPTPKEKVKMNQERDIKLLHYKIFGKEFVKKCMDRQKELSDFDRALGLGVYSMDPNSKWNPQKEYEKVKSEAEDVL